MKLKLIRESTRIEGIRVLLMEKKAGFYIKSKWVLFNNKIAQYFGKYFSTFIVNTIPYLSSITLILSDFVDSVDYEMIGRLIVIE